MEKRVFKFYFDMDGVLADFNGKKNAVKRFENEKGFFKKLKPLKKGIKEMKFLQKMGYEINILSASPNDNADQDKIAWIRKHLKGVKLHNIIMMRNGEVKADAVENLKNAVLIDDYGKNCREWAERGGLAVKVKVSKKEFKVLG